MKKKSTGEREHFGSGRLVADPRKSVFINCPFDQEFSELLPWFSLPFAVGFSPDLHSNRAA